MINNYYLKMFNKPNTSNKIILDGKEYSNSSNFITFDNNDAFENWLKTGPKSPVHTKETLREEF